MSFEQIETECSASEYNPMKKFLPKNDSVAHCSALGNVCSPILEELRDNDYFHRIFSIYPIVPFFDGSDVTLRFFERMYKLCPTHASIIKDQVDYACGLGWRVEQGTDIGVEPEADIIRIADRNQKAEYVNFVKSALGQTQFNDLLPKMKKAAKNLKVTGNYFLELVLTETAGVKNAALHIYDSEMCRYQLANRDAEIKYVYISQSWDWSYISVNKPAILPLYPNFEVDSFGTQRTIIHIKNEEIGRYWYGEPDSISGMFMQYMEYQLGEYSTKGYANNWTGKFFVQSFQPIDADEEVEQSEKFKDGIDAVFTNKGGSRSIFHQNNPLGKDFATTVQEMASKTDEQFHKAMEELSKAAIIRSHRWHSILIESTAGKLGGGGEYQEIVKNKFWTVIKPLQEMILSGFRIAFDEIETWVGYANLDNLTIGLSSLMERMLLEWATAQIQANVTQNIIHNTVANQTP
jgi:hypothetical protein